MKLPTQEEIALAKSEALVRFGRDEVLLVQLAKPVEFALLIAPLNLERHCALVDAQAHDLTTSHGPVVLDSLVWPSREEWLAVAKKRPAAPRKVVTQLLRRAGREDDAAIVKPLAELVDAFVPDKDDAALSVLAPSKVRSVIPGLSAAKARELLDAEEKTEEPRELWAVYGPGVSCVMAAPEPDVYLASSVALDRAREAKQGITQARLAFTKDSIVWSQSPIDSALDDKPAISGDLAAAWLTMGGEVAEATSKSF